MSRQLQNLEFNSFVKGFITEAGPLTFPENATIDEQNFVLNKDGSRNRRLGMDYEEGYTERTLSVTPSLQGLVTQTYVWKNAGGDNRKEILVVQIGRELAFYDNSADTISDNLIVKFTDVTTDFKAATFATVNGILVAATGEYQLTSFEYAASTITKSNFTLQVRDLFGVEDVQDGVNLRTGQGVSLRPSTLSSAHTYNLRNQSFGIPRRNETTATLDPILSFFTKVGKYPSNADSIAYALYPDAQNSENRLVERFFPKDLADNPPGNFAAANGSFIIDILRRGTTRTAALVDMHTIYPELIYNSVTLPEDYTEEGATVVKEYAGRVFYAGFKDDVVNGDKHSPRLGNHVLFSQVIKNTTDLPKCYQEADPTSNVFSDLVATDGGLVRLEGAFNIQQMEVINNTLIVFAQNGIWAISGGSDYGFEATNYRVDKITDHGIVNRNTVVNVDNSLAYWGVSGIYTVGPDQYGKLAAQNISSATIQTFYDNIPVDEKAVAKGVYDSFRRQVRWLFNCSLTADRQASELILDVGLGAFYLTRLGNPNAPLPRPVSLFRTPSFQEGLIQEEVTVSGVLVTVAGEEVTVSRFVQKPVLSEIKYLVVTSKAPLKYTVAYYKDLNFVDWKSYNGIGYDAKAYMITGWTTLNDTQRDKQSPYVHFHLRKSERGFEQIDGELYPVNPSSCLVQAQWEWSNSVRSGRWSNPFQAYRHKRFYSPADVSDEYDDGVLVVTTKNKLRGHGKALSMYIETEPGKDCQIIGWSHLVAIETNV